MKRFMLFVGAGRARGGGWDDFDSAFDTLAEAIAADPGFPGADWAHIIDTDLVGTDANDEVWWRDGNRIVTSA